jgi:cytochrome c
MLKRIFVTFLICLTTLYAQAQKGAAKDLVKESIIYAKANGIFSLLYEINSPKGKFHTESDANLYVFVFDEKGTCRAQGFNSGSILGVNRWNNKDADGKFFLREIISKGLAGGGWVDYRYLNSKNGKVESKTSYVESLDKMIIGCSCSAHN